MVTSIEEARELELHGLGAESQVCGNCRHFCWHYMKNGKPMFAGHCRYPRMKFRNVTASCDRFEEKPEE